MSLPVNKILQGDCIAIMKQWPDNSIDCCVTSPPYWGLRDYGVDGQLGLEQTPEEYVAKMVDVFAQVCRVLKPEGTLWLNLGDSYYNYRPGAGQSLVKQSVSKTNQDLPQLCSRRGNRIIGLKEKDLCGIPWRVAFALQQYGWYLRQDIIWHKPNPMPESVQDRCTKSHEYIFLLSKSQKYYFDNDIIKEEASYAGQPRGDGHRYDNQGFSKCGQYDTRNKRSVWTVAVKPYFEAHFATFPPELITPCILAGCPEDGIVLDPFMGSGTTAMVAYENRRNYTGCELNPEYIKLNRAKKAQEKYALIEGTV